MCALRSDGLPRLPRSYVCILSHSSMALFVCGFIRAIIGQAVRWSKLFDLPPIPNGRSYAVAHFKPDFACGDRSGTSSWMFFIFALGERKNEKRKTGTYHCT